MSGLSGELNTVAIDSRRLGQRLQEARMRRGATQHEAAEWLGVARTTIVAMEKGERRVRPEELVRLAQFYGVAVNDLVRERPMVEDFVPQFRTLLRREDEPSQELERVMLEFHRLCEDYLELERLCGAPLRRREPPEYDTLRTGAEGIEPEQAAEELATAERDRLGLGDAPIGDLRHLLENDVGMRIFGLEMPPKLAKLAGMFGYTDELGGCVAVNRWHPAERRRVSMAHEYAHLLTARYRPEFTVLGKYERMPASERLANAFAVAFLLPEAGVRTRFLAVQRARGGFAAVTPADLLTLADYYGVSLEALVLRLEDLRLLPPGIWERLKGSGLKVREAQTVLKLSGARQEPEEILPLRYRQLSVQAYQDEKISEGQLARFLRTDRVGAREILERVETRVVVTDEGAVERLELEHLGGPVGAH